LYVKVRIKNQSSTKKVNYRTWRGPSFSLSRDFATATDNFGNVLKRIDFGFATKIVDAIEAESIYPNALVHDVLIFERPIEGTVTVEIELPQGNIGESGDPIKVQLAMGKEPEIPATDEQSGPKELIDRSMRQKQEEEKRVEEEQRRRAEEQERLAEEAEYRTWKTADGKYSVEANFIKFAAGILTLEKRDGSTVDVKLDILSPDDQDFVRRRGNR
jgi:hypothetical protein